MVPASPSGIHRVSGSGFVVAVGNNSSTGWSQVGNSSQTAPSIRDMSMMAYDPLIGKVVLFGGYDPAVFPLGDTWEYGNGTWRQVVTAWNAAPAPRWHGGMVWDAADDVIVLFGGRNLTQFFNDTWTFNGTGWTQVHTSSAPSPRGSMGMAYDGADGYVLLQGGSMGNVPVGSGTPWTFYADTWSYRAGAWSRVISPINATAGELTEYAMAYDPGLREVLAYGGDVPTSPSVSDTLWSYSAGNWTVAGTNGSASPGALYAETMAYYPADHALLLFGGVSSPANVSTSETWELRNGTWSDLTANLTGAPSPRDEAVMAYDTSDQKMVLFGGNLQGSWYDYYDDTWVYPGAAGSSGSGGGNGSGGNHSGGSGGGNGSGSSGTPNTCTVHGWCLLSTPVAPADRDMTSMAFDPMIGAVVMFGGYSQYVYPFGDTWTYANGSWTDVSSVMLNSPPARWGDSLVWDAADHYMLMFGGRNLTQFYNDTWAFNGSSWVQVPTASAPSPRNNFAMTYDARSGSVILYGGWRGNLPAGSYSPGIHFADTWSYRAGVWSNITPSASPPAYNNPAFAYDKQTGSAYLYGEPTGNACPLAGQLWSFANGTWSNLSGGSGAEPSGSAAGSMTYYPGFGGELYFGGALGNGCTASSTNGTYELVGGSWRNLSANLTSAPSPRYEAMMTYDPIDEQVVLFGGALQGSWTAYYNDTWVFPANRTHGNGSGSGSGGSGGGSGGNGNGNDSPIAHASQTVDLGPAPLSVLFSAVATVTAGQASYAWSFGDGTGVTGGALVHHTFTVPGTYTPRVRVTDSLGRTTVVPLSPVHVLGTSVAPGRAPTAGGPEGLAAVSSPLGLLSGAAVGVAAVLAAAVAFEERRERRRLEAVEVLRELGAGTSATDL